MRHVLLTGAMLFGAFMIIQGTAAMIENSHRADAAVRASLQQSAELATPTRATPAAAITQTSVRRN
jgi:hypothetical protein